MDRVGRMGKVRLDCMLLQGDTKLAYAERSAAAQTDVLQCSENPRKFPGANGPLARSAHQRALAA